MQSFYFPNWRNSLTKANIQSIVENEPFYFQAWSSTYSWRREEEERNNGRILLARPLNKNFLSFFDFFSLKRIRKFLDCQGLIVFLSGLCFLDGVHNAELAENKINIL